MSIHIVQKDLFTSQGPKAHCVSQDLRMGAGIAKVFRSKYGRVQELKEQHPQVGKVVWLQDVQVFYLVTKVKYFHKPTYQTLESSLRHLAQLLDAHNLTSIHLPKIGCGLDKLDWSKVQELLKKTLGSVDVFVYDFTPSTPKPSKSKAKDAWKTLFARKTKKSKLQPTQLEFETKFVYSDHAKLKVANVEHVENWKKLVTNAIDECKPHVQTRQIQIMGKWINQPRETAFFGPDTIEGYHYSNQMTKAVPIPPTLQLVLDKLNSTMQSNFNGILVNYYHGPGSSIGFHSDAETGLGPGGDVVSLSFQGARKFQIKEKATNRTLYTHITNPCEIMVMEGTEFQSKLLHGIPKQVSVEDRWSLTFRTHKVVGFVLGIAGSRDITDYQTFTQELDKFLSSKQRNLVRIVSGGARGVDSLAEKFAKERNISMQILRADWDRFGKSAGYKRNVQIVDASDELFVMWDGTSKGTQHTIHIAHTKKKPCFVV